MAERRSGQKRHVWGRAGGQLRGNGWMVMTREEEASGQCGRRGGVRSQGDDILDHTGAGLARPCGNLCPMDEQCVQSTSAWSSRATVVGVDGCGCCKAQQLVIGRRASRGPPMTSHTSRMRGSLVRQGATGMLRAGLYDGHEHLTSDPSITCPRAALAAHHRTYWKDPVEVDVARTPRRLSHDRYSFVARSPEANQVATSLLLPGSRPYPG